MASDISSGGRSEFLAARKFFRANSINSKEEVEVFVEDKIDSVFWRHFFSKYEGDKIFKIRTLKNNDNEICGKESLIRYIQIDSLGPNKLIAIDSDYDYLIDNYHSYTNKIRECKYVIHTCDAYSIENYKILPSLLKNAIYLTSLCDAILEDIDNMLFQASKLYFNLFAIHLFSTNKKDNEYPQPSFKADLSRLQYKNDAITDQTKNYVQTKFNSLESTYLNNNKSEFDPFLEYLKLKGVKENNCWQYMKGHDVFNEIGIKIVTGISCKYRGEYKRWINGTIKDTARKQNLLDEFDNITNVKSGCHNLKDRIKEILYDIKPDMTWQPSVKIDNKIRDAINVTIH